jgi:hypothetical protein
MQDETTPHDSGAMPPASDGSHGVACRCVTLSKAERRAIEGAMQHWGQCADSIRGLPTDVRIEAASLAETLRGLLERMR